MRLPPLRAKRESLMRDVIFNYIFVTISEQADDWPLHNSVLQQRYVISQKTCVN